MQGSFLLRKTVKPPHFQRMAIGRRQGRDQVEHPAQLQPRAHFLLGRGASSGKATISTICAVAAASPAPLRWRRALWITIERAVANR
jgi:hypothetical protein